jgi:Flp pilus assembly protein TadD
MTSKLPAQEIEHLYAAGWAALQGGGLSEAEESFLGVLAADPDHVDALNGLGTVYFHEKRLEEAETLYEKARKTALKFYRDKMPDHVDWDAPHDRALLRALHGLALVSFRRGDSKDAEKRLNQLVKLNPKDNTGAKFLLADIKKGRKKWDAAG